MNFGIDDHMNLKWDKEMKQSRELRDEGWGIRWKFLTKWEWFVHRLFRDYKILVGKGK